jgi:hypothetical protein
MKKLIANKDGKSILVNGKDGKSILVNGKKGIILKNVINLVMAVLCLIILFYLGSQLYGMLIQKSAFEQAKTNIEEISNRINRLPDGDSSDYKLISPSDWFLIIYNKGTTQPVSCSGKDCICICSYDIPEQCDKGGACKSFDFTIEPRPSLKINKFYNLNFKREGNIIKGYNEPYQDKEQR